VGLWRPSLSVMELTLEATSKIRPLETSAAFAGPLNRTAMAAAAKAMDFIAGPFLALLGFSASGAEVSTDDLDLAMNENSLFGYGVRSMISCVRLCEPKQKR
jgi:hypothetical protein